ncbi:dethiobiotin synthase [Pseudomonas syringae]|uniref:dethiobiotin synthase n=1 Tax=Pseudomonas syringae TaxID=317 RepID=UPI00040DB9E9|nr:dethiobiotin synthase [Pseudomonas syringae]
MSAAYFITGTDTDAGKTTVAAGLLHAARLAGLSTAAGKPVASGCVMTAQGLRNADALALQAECSVELDYDEVNPLALEPAIAPHLAAREAGIVLTVESLLQPMRHILSKQADFTLIEGAGGWRVPLAGERNLSDLAIALKLPVILVVGVRLGCINHAVLTTEAIARDGLMLAGWVANVIDGETSRLEENLATLVERLPAPCLGQVPRLEDASAENVAHYLDIGKLG